MKWKHLRIQRGKVACGYATQNGDYEDFEVIHTDV